MWSFFDPTLNTTALIVCGWLVLNTTNGTASHYNLSVMIGLVTLLTLGADGWLLLTSTTPTQPGLIVLNHASLLFWAAGWLSWRSQLRALFLY